MIKALIAKIRNFPVVFWWGFAAGRIASANATQRHWYDTVQSAMSRAQSAEKRAESAECALAYWQREESTRALEVQRLRAVLETRNLHGGWMPNG